MSSIYKCSSRMLLPWTRILQPIDQNRSCRLMTEHFGRVKPDDGCKRLCRPASRDHIYRNADTIHIPSALWTSEVIKDHKAIQQSLRLCETALQGRIQDFNLGDVNSVAEGHEGEGCGRKYPPCHRERRLGRILCPTSDF